VDQPVEDGGGDAGPTPSELFVASLASCVVYFAGGFLARHAIDPSGLGVEATYEYSEDRPSRVSTIDIRVALPVGFPESKLAAFHKVVDACTVHNSLKQAPHVEITAGLPLPAA
jgi:uncharacterized OsmC-like protein